MINFVAGIVGVAASIDLEMLPVAVPHSEKTQIGGPCESPQQMREGVYGLYGNFKKANRPGRLTIRTPSGSSCFIKLETALGGSRVMSLRVHGGSTLDADVPLGTFALKYAAGAMWYGERDLFGKDTALFKAKDACTFEKES